MDVLRSKEGIFQPQGNPFKRGGPAGSFLTMREGEQTRVLHALLHRPRASACLE